VVQNKEGENGGNPYGQKSVRLARAAVQQIGKSARKFIRSVMDEKKKLRKYCRVFSG